MKKKTQNRKEEKSIEQEMFSAVRSVRVSEGIEEQLKEAIINRHYRAGDKLPPERELAEIFGASRSSIREAIRSLEASGFVVIKKGVHGGAFVIEKGESKTMIRYLRDVLRFRQVTLEEVLQSRLIFEPEVAAEAARRATAKDIERLQEITQHQLKGFNPHNPAMQYDRNPRFHRVLAEITGNQVFIIIMETLMEIHSHRINQFEVDEKAMEEITAQHKDIIEALRSNDSKMAYEKVKSHIIAVHHLHKQLDSEHS
ncbi:MAG: FadR family transcriptional regulator [Desulfobacteraceae bacterium]|nr:FadR family transcriptional regulator [Desulfobacteraceae bacterium]